MRILVGVDSDVPRIGNDLPANPADLWDIFDHQANAVIDRGVAFGTPGANGWNLSKNAVSGRYTLHPPLTADVSGAEDRYEFRVNPMLA